MSTRHSDAPAIIAPPPLLYLGALGLGLVLHFLVPIGRFPALPARLLGVVVLAAAGALAKWAKDTMRRAGTSMRPDRPTTAIVADGPFRYSRNPLYLATAGLYLGVALLLDAVWPVVLLLPLLAVLDRGVIRREERYLEAKFGDVYRTYKARVRRWI